MEHNYKAFYERYTKFYNKHPWAKVLLASANIFFTWLFVGSYLILWISLLSADPYSQMDGLRAMLPLGICVLTATALRMMMDRARPYAEDGANITPLVKRKKTDRNSCPSRHLACAMTISLICLHFSTVVGALLLLSCFILAYARFATGLHYPSDLLFGAAVGFICGTLTFLL